MESGRPTPYSDASDVQRMYQRFREEVAHRRRAADGPAEIASAVPEAQRPLSVQVCELYARDNAAHHHTERFDAALNEPHTPILRRGQPFMLAVRFDRPYDASRDAVQFLFEFENSKGNNNKGLSRLMKVVDRKPLRQDSKCWDATLLRTESRDPNTTIFQIMISSQAKVGVWVLVVQTERKDTRGVRNEFRSTDLIYILFNPWSKEDDVYMENDAWRQEYVLNDNGKVWTGTAQSVFGKPWVFGQFDDVVLPCVLMLLHASRLSAVDRGNPVLVCRALAEMVNARGDEGLLLQGTADNAQGGVNPSAWTGSAAIMEQFIRTGRPVKYGLAWEYSALMVTACRALGIPCRSVTAYNAAQGRDNAQIIEVRVTRGGEREWSDRVWNFHAWNEVWTARPELPDGYGGWQTVDAAVRDGGQGTLKCGLAPVEGLRRGLVGMGHSALSLFTALNADVWWFVDDGSADAKLLPHIIDTQFVGARIVTKKIGRDDDKGSSDLEDITGTYKYPEGSPGERQAVRNASRSSEFSEMREAIVRFAQDVEFELVDLDGAFFGQEFNITWHVHNASTGHRKIFYTIQAKAADYRGLRTCQLKRQQRVMKLMPKQRETVKEPISVADYLGKVQEDGHISVFVLAMVEETRQTWLKEHKISLRKPFIGIQIKGTAKVGREAVAVCSFQNPVALPLSECGYSVEGHGLLRPKTVPFRDVKPGELVQWEEKIVPRLSGPRKLIANFYSRELAGVTGRASIDVLVS